MVAEEIIIWVGFLEYILLLIFLVVSILFKIGIDWFQRREQRMEKALTTFFSEKMIHGSYSPSDIRIPFPFFSKVLLHTLENFRQRVASAQWNEYCSALVQNYLHPLACRWARSFLWIRRNQAMRIFLLDPQEEDAPYCLLLLQDSSFYIRALAASWMVEIGTRPFLAAFLEQMRKEDELSHYAYRQAVEEASLSVFQEFLSLYQETEDMQIKAFILKVISGRISTDHMPLIEEGLSSQNADLRLAALQLLIHHYGPKICSFLRKLVKDDDSRVRALAVAKLGTEKKEEDLPVLEDKLKDPSYQVRLAAAKGLKRWGRQGTEILERQDSDLSPLAHEIARYALTMP